MKKVALFAFQGELMCFIHVLLNALDLKTKGHEAVVVIEGAACKLVPELAREDNPLHALYAKAKAQGLIAGVCRACSAKMKVTEAVESEGLTFLDDMSGHPGMSGFLAKGYDIISF
jgi:hypothetical protein